MRSPLPIPIAIALILLCPAKALADNLQWARITPIRGQSYVHRYEFRRRELRDYLLLRDSLSTTPRALASLRFNDGSLVRVSGGSLFTFEPNTRNFRLWDGLSLLLLPQGTVSRIRTPNVSAGTQGTVLAVSYEPLNEVSTVVMIASSAVVSLPGNRDVLLQSGQALVYVGAAGSVDVFSVDLAYLVANSAIAEGGFLDVPEVSEAVSAQQAGYIPALPSIGGSGPVELPGSAAPNVGVPEFRESVVDDEARSPVDVPPVDAPPAAPADVPDDPQGNRPNNGNNGIGTGAREN